jgi:acetate kinase
MKILVINAGSSSIKYELFDMDQRQALSSGLAEKIGEENSVLTHKYMSAAGDRKKIVEKGKIKDHYQGLQRSVDLLMDPQHGVIGHRAEIAAVGHRVVHGGEFFQASTRIDEQVLAAIRQCVSLAPLHNPANLMGIEVARKIFPEAAQVAVFDTAFHQSLPEHAYLYAIPLALYEKHKIRRYGFHGTSHAFVAEAVAAFLRRPLTQLSLITIHLGNGASMCAIQAGKSVDTSMGLTPLAGLPMGTRCGDIDPSILLVLAERVGMSIEDLDELLNKKSGLLGLCGVNDMREVIRKKQAGDKQAKTALKLYSYQIKKYIGAYVACLGHVDALVFTAGIGENSPVVRELCCRNLQALGIEIDNGKNDSPANGTRKISASGSKVKVLVVPTNEELRIAQETQRVIDG